MSPAPYLCHLGCLIMAPMRISLRMQRDWHNQMIGLR